MIPAILLAHTVAIILAIALVAHDRKE